MDGGHAIVSALLLNASIVCFIVVFISAGWAIHISWSNAVCLCIWMLTRVAQII